MEEDRKMTNQLDVFIESENREGLDEFIVQYLRYPILLKDIEDYLFNRKRDSLSNLWTRCYLEKFHQEILPLYESYYFSQKHITQNQHSRFGIIDMVLLINYSNIKGLPLFQFSGDKVDDDDEDGQGIRRFFLTQHGKVRDQLYQPVVSARFTVLNPDQNLMVLTMFHVKMRQIAFHFLYWLSERVSDREVLIQYGNFLLEREYDGQDKEEFFFPLSLLGGGELENEAREELREIIGRVEEIHGGGGGGGNDAHLFAQSYNQEEMCHWMSDKSERMTTIFKERCCSFSY